MSRKGSLKRLSSDHLQETFSDMVEEEVSRLGLHSWSETLQERTIHFQVVVLSMPILFYLNSSYAAAPLNPYALMLLKPFSPLSPLKDFVPWSRH